MNLYRMAGIEPVINDELKLDAMDAMVRAISRLFNTPGMQFTPELLNGLSDFELAAWDLAIEEYHRSQELKLARIHGNHAVLAEAASYSERDRRGQVDALRNLMRANGVEVAIPAESPVAGTIFDRYVGG